MNVAIALCDRGTIDGLAYWPGPDELWPAVGTSLDEQLARYDAVIHLRGENRDDAPPGIDHAVIREREARIEALARNQQS